MGWKRALLLAGTRVRVRELYYTPTNQPIQLDLPPKPLVTPRDSRNTQRPPSSYCALSEVAKIPAKWRFPVAFGVALVCYDPDRPELIGGPSRTAADEWMRFVDRRTKKPELTFARA